MHVRETARHSILSIEMFYVKTLEIRQLSLKMYTFIYMLSIKLLVYNCIRNYFE